MIRVGMAGTNRGNGHPYSWSAIMNGYDRDRMAVSPYPRIAAYLGRETTPAIDGACVTHVWSADRDEADAVARTCFIPNIVARPEDMVGAVDAVILPTDEADRHLTLAEPFLAAGLPLLVDKPLALDQTALRAFERAASAGHPLMSCSAVRFSAKLAAMGRRLRGAGTALAVQGVTRHTWDHYGVHLLEAISVLCPEARPLRIRQLLTPGLSTAVVTFDTGLVAVLVVAERGAPSIGLGVCTTDVLLAECLDDWFVMFREMLTAFLAMVAAGTRPVPFEDTRRITEVLIAGRRSRAEGGREVAVAEVARS